ncbi:hypothetical protein H9636_07265 [Ureibacillus sp. Re31]|uniref:DNA-binding protein n=1 Tax=Ureibacillus galli TaxID=2762222 RepID=A0ABR8XB74_9BACL|nr:hypothetical protein [Ureibacillus galli]MBD8026457.1 hypothetical protein [Ureibacillus galli]
MEILFSKEEKQALIKELANELAPVLVDLIKKQSTMPALLTRKEFMEFVGVGETKCAELFKRHDFPVTYEFGHPRVPTSLLLEWINANTDWVRANTPKYNMPYKVG